MIMICLAVIPRASIHKMLCLLVDRSVSPYVSRLLSLFDLLLYDFFQLTHNYSALRGKKLEGSAWSRWILNYFDYFQR